MERQNILSRPSDIAVLGCRLMLCIRLIGEHQKALASICPALHMGSSRRMAAAAAWGNISRGSDNSSISRGISCSREAVAAAGAAAEPGQQQQQPGQ